jgi:hypothetical protein
MQEHPKPYPWEEINAELVYAASQGQRLANFRCATCNASFISSRDAWNHNVSVYGPGYHQIVTAHD